MAAHQAPSSLGFSRQEHWSGLPFPSPMHACVLSHFSRLQLYATLWTAAHQAPLPTGFSRQECWSGLPFPSPVALCVGFNFKYFRSTPTKNWIRHWYIHGLVATSYPTLETPWTVACQAPPACQAFLFFTISRSLLKLMFIELVMPFNDLILWTPLLLLPSIFPNIRVFLNDLVLAMLPLNILVGISDKGLRKKTSNITTILSLNPTLLGTIP